MNFSEDENDNYEIIDNHLQKIQDSGVKKYVVSINNKYTSLIDEMSIDERNEIINDIIAEYNDHINEKKQFKIYVKTGILILIFILVLLFAAPGVLWLINKSFTMTKNNYNEMKTLLNNKLEKLELEQQIQFDNLK